MNFLQWLTNPAVKAVSFALVTVAIAVKSIASPHTIAAKVADQVIEVGVLLGISSNGVQKPKE